MGFDAARLSTSAALINYSAFHSFVDHFACAIVDQDAHLTIKQGVAAAFPSARRHVVPHADLEALERMLARLPAPALVCVDGVYSMRGTLAPTASLAASCARYGATLFLDDVHGFGVLGERGTGVVEAVPAALRPHVILLASFAKSASNPVAFVAYPERHWMAVEGIPALNYSGPPSNLHVAVCARHIDQWGAMAERRLRVRAASAALHGWCERLGVVTLSPSGSPILAVGLLDAYAEPAVEALAADGILCKLAVYPVVRRGDEVLRFTLTASHTDAQLQALMGALRGLVPFLRRSA